MTIEEAIQHCHEVAEKECTECGKEHLQLAEWLTELKQRKEDANKQPKTNADKIRAMSDSELANMLSSIWICHHFDSCEKCPLAEAENCRADGVKRWLKQGVNEDEND